MEPAPASAAPQLGSTLWSVAAGGVAPGSVTRAALASPQRSYHCLARLMREALGGGAPPETTRIRMSGGPLFQPSSEYEALRRELLQLRRYVFERPLLIVTLAAAGLRLLGSAWAATVAVAYLLLLLFNFWFTVNRLRSMSRIAAYIQLVLEERAPAEWLGWETSLRRYRMWRKDHRDDVPKAVARHSDSRAVPGGLMFYAPIYLLHVLMAVGGGTAFIIWAFTHGSRGDQFASLPVLAVTGLFMYCAIIHGPRRVRPLVEHERAIWMQVLLQHPCDREDDRSAHL